jgi:rod shape determining protein RodA
VILPLILLACIGLFILLTTNTGLFWQQLLFLVLGAGIVYIVSKLDSVVLWWLAPYGYIASIFLLIVTYLGPSVRGATRWIMIGNFQLQPSEIAKPLFLLAFARVMTSRSPRTIRNLLFHATILLVPALLVFKQPDLGTSLVYAFSWFFMMLAGGLSIPLVIAGIAAFAAAAPFLWHVLAQYQKNRIETFLNPALDPKGAGYNALQAMIAVGSGQLFGLGLGRGTQSHLRFLPEYHTDFIFATLVEELGFIGGACLIILYGALLWQLLAPFIRNRVSNPFVFFYTIGLFGMLFAQVVINSGMNMGIIPVTGITLPLVSYGGSSILSLAVAFGFLFALRRGSSPLSDIAFR